MKKSTLLKLALLFVAIFMFAGAYAQTNTGQWATTPTVGKYDQTAAAPILLPASVTYTDYVTTGKTMPFWVWPSAAYNPNWNPAGPFVNANYPTSAEIATASVLSSFGWRVGTGANGAAALAALAVNGTNVKNYIELTAGAVGSVTLMEVTETSPTIACPGSAVYYGFTSIALPTVTITNAVSTTLGLSNVIASACSGAAALTTSVTATFAPALEVNPYWINMPYRVLNANLDAGGNIDLVGATDITATASVNLFGVDAATVPSAANPIIANASPIVASKTYVVENSKITVYEFTYNNVNAAISRKSDYIAARAGNWTATSYGSFTYYPIAPAATKYYIIALPVPVTGPIYHIANNFSY